MDEEQNLQHDVCARWLLSNVFKGTSFVFRVRREARFSTDESFKSTLDRCVKESASVACHASHVICHVLSRARLSPDPSDFVDIKVYFSTLV